MNGLKFPRIFLLVMLVISSCKNENKTTPTERSQMQEVLAVHDEVMPKMGKIGQLISELDSKIKETDSTEALVKANQNLKDSHKAMMDWMKGFGERFDSEEIMNGKALTEEKKRFLDDEESKIKALRDQMNVSIKNAEDLLK